MVESDSWEGTAGPEHHGMRVDKFLTEQLDPDISRSMVQQWIRSGEVLVNEQRVKANHKLSSGDEVYVQIPPLEDTELVPQNIPLDIVYEDADVIVINKQRGMVVHPAPGHPDGTLVNALLYHCRDLSGIHGELRPGIVHRIDKDTSGLIMAAKHDTAHIRLAEQLREHSVTRKYVAFAHGTFPHRQGTIDAPIGRDPSDRKLFVVTDKNSKKAVTHFAVVEQFAEYAMLELQLETGRTHQIRVHMKFIGHPLVGDPLYGYRDRKADIEGQALHAAVLGFVHPRTEKYLEFEAPLPDDMALLSERLRAGMI